MKKIFLVLSFFISFKVLSQSDFAYNNPELYVGKTLIVNPVKHAKEFNIGYGGFYKKIKKDFNCTMDFFKNDKETSNYVLFFDSKSGKSNYDSLVGKVFQCVSTTKLEDNCFFLKLKNNSIKDTVYYKYKSLYKSDFCFTVEGGLVKQATVVPVKSEANKLDEKNGFRTFNFGTSRIIHPCLKLVGASLNDSIFYCKTDTLKIGESKLEGIKYAYFKQKLYCIIIKTSENYGFQILDVFQAAYGNGRKTNEFLENRIWSTNNILMLYDHNQITGTGTISIYNKALMSEKNEFEKEKNKKAAAGL